MGDEVDPAHLYRVQAELSTVAIYTPEDVERFCRAYFKPKQTQSTADHEALNAALDPAVSRFTVLMNDKAEEAELWRGKVQAFRNLYGFLSQIIPYQDSDLEKLFVFLRHLSPKLPRRDSLPSYNFDDSVRLDYYRLQKISEGSISLKDSYAIPLDGPTEVGTGMVHEDAIPLSRLVDLINDRFGTEFNQADQYFLDQIVETAILNESVIKAAEVNPEEKFELIFNNLLKQLFIERIDQNEDIFARFMNEESFQKFLTNGLAAEAFRKLKKAQEESLPHLTG